MCLWAQTYKSIRVVAECYGVDFALGFRGAFQDESHEVSRPTRRLISSSLAAFISICAAGQNLGLTVCPFCIWIFAVKGYELGLD